MCSSTAWGAGVLGSRFLRLSGELADRRLQTAAFGRQQPLFIGRDIRQRKLLCKGLQALGQFAVGCDPLLDRPSQAELDCRSVASTLLIEEGGWVAQQSFPLTWIAAGLIGLHQSQPFGDRQAECGDLPAESPLVSLAQLCQGESESEFDATAIHLGCNLGSQTTGQHQPLANPWLAMAQEPPDLHQGPSVVIQEILHHARFIHRGQGLSGRVGTDQQDSRLVACRDATG